MIIRSLVLIAFVVLLWCLIGLSMQTTTSPAAKPKQIEKLKIAGEEFEFEVAADDASREKGLMNRKAEELATNQGMIFIHPDVALRSFWMKNCLMDIDIAFLDAEGEITATHAMKAEPLRKPRESQAGYEARLKKYPSRKPAQYALEFKPGTIERLKLKPGQKIEGEWQRLKKLAR
jgi:uncharacterized protein